MVYDDLFGPWGRILLVGFGSGIVVITLLLIACFLTPGCLGYECIRKRKKENKAVPLRIKRQSNENVKLNDISYRSWRLGSLYDNGSTCENVESHRNSINSNSAQFEITDASSTMNLIEVEKQKGNNKLKEFPIELTMSLQYLPVNEENVTGKLVIGIEAMSNLPAKLYNYTPEPYVALNIMKQTWTYGKKQKLHSFRTRGVRHTTNPIYRETFVIADVAASEAKEWILYIAAYDYDRYANDTELCSLKVLLREVKKIFASPEIHLFNYKMKPSNEEYGNILLGISYLPTAQRVAIKVVRLCNLTIVPRVAGVNEFNPYVKVLMLNGKTRRRIKRKRTKVLRAIAEPEFNETLTFDLSYNQLENVQFLIVLCSKILPQETASNGHISDSEDSVNSNRRSEDIFIGKVILGKGVRGTTERMHWFSVLQNPRKLVTVWHTLK